MKSIERDDGVFMVYAKTQFRIFFAGQYAFVIVFVKGWPIDTSSGFLNGDRKNSGKCFYSYFKRLGVNYDITW